MRLRCDCCDAPLAPAFTGLRCPRFSACGRSGIREDAYTLLPSALFTLRPVPLGVRA